MILPVEIVAVFVLMVPSPDRSRFVVLRLNGYKVDSRARSRIATLRLQVFPKCRQGPEGKRVNSSVTCQPVQLSSIHSEFMYRASRAAVTTLCLIFTNSLNSILARKSFDLTASFEMPRNCAISLVDNSLA